MAIELQEKNKKRSNRWGSKCLIYYLRILFHSFIDPVDTSWIACVSVFDII